MGGFFGAALKRDCIYDVFFGVDYHSHLGTRSAGISVYDSEMGLQRSIHSIENTPFRTKFEHILEDMRGKSAIGCINDFYPQPLIMRSGLGTFSICSVGAINNADELVDKYVGETGGHFGAMTAGKINHTELLAALISRKESFEEGIAFAQSVIDGTAAILILTNDGSVIAARDALGRLPMLIGASDDGYCVTFESFAYEKLGFSTVKELGPGEIVKITKDGLTQLKPAGKRMRMCAFLWSYYGYSTSTYNGVNVELMRYRNGEVMSKNDRLLGKQGDIDYVCGIPDSGTPHAIGYANESKIPFARPFIKYTPTWPRSFITAKQLDRDKIAKMKQVPISGLIKDKNLLFVDDSIVRGTQLRETVDFLYSNGAKSVHMRSACPPLMYGCKYLSFSSAKNDMELIARRTVVELEGEEGLKYLREYSDPTTERGELLRKTISKKFSFASLEFQTIEGIIEAIGIDRENLCTYCWTGED